MKNRGYELRHAHTTGYIAFKQQNENNKADPGNHHSLIEDAQDHPGIELICEIPFK